MCVCVCAGMCTGRFLEKTGPRFSSLCYPLLPKKPKSSPESIGKLLRLEPNQGFHNPSLFLPHLPISFTTASLGLEKSFQPSACSLTARNPPLRHTYIPSQSFSQKGLSIPSRKVWVSGREQGTWRRRGRAGRPWVSHFKLEASGLSQKFHLKRSFLADKIKAFPLPNHYLIFQAIIELIVSISLVSSCSSLSLSSCACGRHGLPGPASPTSEGRAGAGPRPGELSGCFQQGSGRYRATGGALLRSGDPASLPCVPCYRCRSALFPRRHTCTPDVAREGEPPEPRTGMRPIRPGLGAGPAEENAEREPRCPLLPDSGG